MNPTLCHLHTWRLATLLLTLLFIALAGCGGGRKADPLPPGTLVLALGDSIAAGYGISQERAWPALLATQTGWIVINAGVTGDTSSDALARLPGLLDAHAPRLVLVELGGNDMLRRLSEEETVASLGRAIDAIRARGAATVLMAIPRPSVAGVLFQSLAPAKFYRTLADARKAPLIENAVSEVLSDPELRLDALHPNERGHEVLAQKTVAALREMGYVR